MTSHPSARKTFNRAAVLEQIGNDESLLLTIIEVFLVDSPDIRSRLLATLANGSPDELGAIAHCAKSAVGNFFAEDAVNAAIALENACKARQTAQFEPLTRVLHDTLIDVEASLRLELTP